VSDAERQYDRVQAVARRHLGIELGNQDGARMVANRLRDVDDVDALLEAVEADPPDRARLLALADLLTTNVTSFGRHREVFAACAEHLLARGRRELRIWSAGCATGEEAYDLAMMAWGDADRVEPLFDFQVLATDISPSALRSVREARYDAARVPPTAWGHFVQEAPGKLRVAPRLRARVTVRSFNLLTVPYPFEQPFDVVFVRNVLIYFDPVARAQVLDRMLRLLLPDGLLAVGACEVVPGLSLEARGHGLYQRSSPRAVQPKSTAGRP
jgi:chemotaxis protein methyltransferase CheR